jgi:hypothetical protein
VGREKLFLQGSWSAFAKTKRPDVGNNFSERKMMGNDNKNSIFEWSEKKGSLQKPCKNQ